MLSEFLTEIVVITVGKGYEPVADLLNSTRFVNEFNIAKKLGITINQTRNILYKISDYGLLLSERQKDKKKGWYTYYWKFDKIKCLDFLKKRILDREAQFKTQIQRREEKNYYVCEFCNIECSEDEALLQEFTCDECGELLTQKDNSALLKGMKKNLEKLEEKIAAIDVEMAKEKKKNEKKKMMNIRRLEKEAEAKKELAKQKRAEKKAIRDKEKEEKRLADEAAGIIKPKKTRKKTTKKKAVKKTIKKVVKKVSKKSTSTRKIVKKKAVAKKKVIKKPVKKTGKNKVVSKLKKIVKKKK